MKNLIGLAFVVIITLTSCNPVKRVLRDKKLLDQVAEEVIRQGYCVNDTVFSTVVKDTVIYKDSIIHEQIQVKLPKECNLDTIFKVNGLRIKIENGKLSLSGSYKQKQSIKIIKETQSIRDKSLEGILKSDIIVKDFQISEFRAENKHLRTEAALDTFKYKLVIAGLLLFILLLLAGILFKNRLRLPV
jgi:hypothetical protein